jgi:hypothetical protein
LQPKQYSPYVPPGKRREWYRRPHPDDDVDRSAQAAKEEAAAELAADAKVRECLRSVEAATDAAARCEGEETGVRQFVSVSVGELTESDRLATYCRDHMGISKNDLKDTAIARIYDLALLFRQLETNRTVRLYRDPNGGVNCIFGFYKMEVKEVTAFNAAFTEMVHADRQRCW